MNGFEISGIQPSLKQELVGTIRKTPQILGNIHAFHMNPFKGLTIQDYEITVEWDGINKTKMWKRDTTRDVMCCHTKCRVEKRQNTKSVTSWILLTLRRNFTKTVILHISAHLFCWIHFLVGSTGTRIWSIWFWRWRGICDSLGGYPQYYIRIPGTNSLYPIIVLNIVAIVPNFQNVNSLSTHLLPARTFFFYFWPHWWYETIFPRFLSWEETQ